MTAPVENLSQELAVLLRAPAVDASEDPARRDTCRARRAAALERRDDASIRIAHYSPYPRVTSDQRVQSGVVRWRGSELLLATAVEAPVGELLRVDIDDIEGESSVESLARVTRCAPRQDGGYDLALEHLDPNQPLVTGDPVGSGSRRVRRPHSA